MDIRVLVFNSGTFERKNLSKMTEQELYDLWAKDDADMWSAQVQMYHLDEFSCAFNDEEVSSQDWLYFVDFDNVKKDGEHTNHFYKDIKALHNQIVLAIAKLMMAHEHAVVDLLGSNADHCYVQGYAGDGSDVMSMEVNKVCLVNGELFLDVILDIDTEELAAQNENGDIGDAYQCWKANDFEHFIPCAGIELVYDCVCQVLKDNK